MTFWRAIPRAPRSSLAVRDLIVQMRAGVLRPELLVDLRLLGINEIRFEADQVRIGVRVTHTQLAESDLILRYFPPLAAAAREVGGPSTRNRGTLGGNLVNASPSADTVPPLLLYDAVVVMVGKRTERTMPLSWFLGGLSQYRVAGKRDLDGSSDPTATAADGGKLHQAWQSAGDVHCCGQTWRYGSP